MHSSSVVIVSKNGQKWMSEVLEGVLAQQGVPAPEILVIDSGSTDGTLETVKRYPVRLETIPPSEFNHGETRNLGMRLTQGECVALLSQDATPATAGWLKALLDPLKDERTAGSFSRHIPRPESTPLVKRQVFEFDLCGTETSRINELRAGEEGFLRRACFFANSSSCIKRSVWTQHPFSRIDFAEDQEWSLRVLRAGYRTAYAGDSAVLHSHDYPLGSLFMRHFEHAQAMRTIFGTQEIPNLGGLRRGLQEHLKADWRFLNAQPCSSLFVLKWMCLALPWHWVRFWGLWLGSRSDQLPRWLSDGLSLQKRLAKKGTA